MVINGRLDNKPITISVVKTHTTISVGHPETAKVYSFDKAGRLWSAFINGTSYRRSMNGSIMAKSRDSDGRRLRDWLSPVEARRTERSAIKTISGLSTALESQSIMWHTPPPPDLAALLRQITEFDLSADIDNFNTIYRPIGILPPDCYLSLVLQLTEGCSFNTCTFCTFYKDQPFRIKSQVEFEDHCKRVKRYFAAGASLRRGIFLGDANALVLPMNMLVTHLETIERVFQIEQAGGLFSFLDGFSGEKKSIDDYKRLAQYGLSHVYIGLESGSQDLLRFLNKPGTAQDSIAAVNTMKHANVNVGIIVLLGAGGKQFYDQHISETIDAIRKMELSAKDIVYFSELVTTVDMPYAKISESDPLSLNEILKQGETIREGITSAFPNPPKISRYDIREFIY